MAERFNPNLVKQNGGSGGGGPFNPPPGPIPPPGRYFITFDGFTANETRSGTINPFGTPSDTDYATAAAQVNNNQPVTAAISCGDIEPGETAATSLVLGPLDVGPSDSLKFTYLVSNNGHGDAGTIIIGLLGTSVQLLGRYFGANEKILDVATAILTFGLGYVFPDCDGVVAADSLVFSGGQLAELTSANGEHFDSKRIPGTTSPGGCGGNSVYTPFWHVKRVAPPHAGVITVIKVQAIAIQ